MKQIMHFTCLILIGIFMNINYIQAQTQPCRATDGKKVDFYYNSPTFPGMCAQFVLNSATCDFYPSEKAKQPMALPVLDKVVNSETLADVIKKHPKLTAMDVAFLLAAYEQWNKAKLDIGFTILPSGLGYKVIVEGTGKLPEKNKKVKVHYKGYLTDGTKFDSSYDRNDPIEITLGVGQVIKGWDDGIGLFKVGSKGVLKIPAELGYGSRGAGGAIPPNATLFFDIEVVSAE